MEIQRKSLITAGGTLMCALGIGYFMQSTAQPPAATTVKPAAAAAGTGDGRTLTEPELTLDQPEPPAIELSQVKLTSAAPLRPQMPEVSSLSAGSMIDASLDMRPETESPHGRSTPQMACDFEMTATPEAAAMVRLNLSAPCMPNERFTLHHNGMMLSEVTDATGSREFVVPALGETSVFIASFGNGDGAVATTETGALAFYDRAVLQWRGAGGLELHALEFGADYDGDGHVWAGAARDLASAATGEGGFITRLGDSSFEDAFVAEVYTFPSGTIPRSGTVALSIEARVTAANCGREVEAQSIQTTAQGGLQTHALSLPMPDCDALGDFLLLKNVLNDLKVVSN